MIAKKSTPDSSEQDDLATESSKPITAPAGFDAMTGDEIDEMDDVRAFDSRDQLIYRGWRRRWIYRR